MLKVKLDKELQDMKEADMKEVLEPLSEVKLLLEGDAQKDLQIMRNLAGRSEIIANERILGQVLEFENLTKSHGNIFELSQIEELCMKYQLRFLPSTLFKGKMDVEVISKLKAYAKEFNISCLDEHTLKTNFFIMAPPESFSLRISSITNTRKAAAAAERQRRLDDPILFYKVKDEHYAMIHKWGNDFSITRLIKGWYWKNEERYMRIQNLLCFISSVVLFFGFNKLITKFLHPEGATIWFGYVVGCAISFAFFMIVKTVRKFRIKVDSHRTCEGLFTENNWNSSTLWKV